MTTTILLIGGNLGDRMALLRKATEALRSLGEVEALSDIYETEAWGVAQQQPYLNQALALRTPLEAHALLQACLGIEALLGRIRQERWGPRTMDIDIIYYGEMVLNSPTLTLPHPRMAERRFVLIPLCQIAPRWRHPLLGLSSLELLQACPDPLSTALYSQVITGK